MTDVRLPSMQMISDQIKLVLFGCPTLLPSSFTAVPFPHSAFPLRLLLKCISDDSSLSDLEFLAFFYSCFALNIFSHFLCDNCEELISIQCSQVLEKGD